MVIHLPGVATPLTFRLLADAQSLRQLPKLFW
jgi:hypothetical protein